MTSRLLIAALLTLATVALPPAASAQRGAPSAVRLLTPGERSDLRLFEGTAQRLALPARPEGGLTVPMRLDGQDVVLWLWPHSVRASGFTLRVQDADGSWRVQTPPPVSTLRGEVEGHEGSIVAASLRDGRLRALVRMQPEGDIWAVQPLESGAASEHAVYVTSEVYDMGEGCQVVPTGLPSSFAPPPTAEGSTLKVCDIALDADREFFEANGSSVAATDADIEDVINACEAVYLAQTGISYQITTILVRTAEPDPYQSTDAGVVLDEFQADWNANQSGTQRDIAHLFTGKNMDGSTIGIAYLSVICSGSFGYGLSQSLFSGNWSSRVALTNHELGHNWSAGHCNGDADCSIMCSGLGGCSGNKDSFGTAAVAAIEAMKAAAGCLFVGPPIGGPVIDTVSPAFGPHQGGNTIVLAGSDFVDDPSTAVLFDGVAGQIVSAGTNSITVMVPPGTAGKAVDILVNGPTGSTLQHDGYTFEWGITPGDQASSSVMDGDIDRAFFGAAAGWLLSVSLKGQDGLAPGLRLVGPGEVDVITVEDDPAAPKGKVQFKKVELPATGTYRLEVYGLDGSTGAYAMKTKIKAPKASKQVVPVGPSDTTPSVSFDAPAGAVLAKVIFKTKAAKGVHEFVEGLPSALAPSFVGLTGPGGAINLDEVLSVSGSGKAVKLSKLLLDELGVYELELAGVDGSVGHGDLIIAVKPPKAAKVKHTADPLLDG